MSTEMQQWPELKLVEEFPEGTQFEKIPQPPEHLFGFLGNLPDIDPGFMLKSFWQMAETYGPIYYLNALNRKFVIVSSYEYAHQVQDDITTEKIVFGSQEILRKLVGDGLFTAYSEEPAHRLLVPVFGPLGVKKMFPEMLDIASQMILKWDRLGPDNEIMCSDDFTRLAFDTIAICSFNHRFNSFYADNVPEFASRMSEALIEASEEANRTSIGNRLRIFSAARFGENIEFMQKVVDDILDERIKNPQPDVNDLLNVMLEAKDPVSGEKMERDNIRHNMITFLVAGHETTSGTLSFLFHLFLKNPEKMLKAQKEVDDVLGDGPITIKHIPELKYIYACIKEALRLNGPIGGNFRHPKKDLVLSGKYRINKDTGIMINYKFLHRDPKIWGEDVNVFRPERFFEGEKPQDAWKPFGVGMRSCIGRYFAEQEMILNVALILQRFQVTMADPNYTLILKPTLTIKPDKFAIKVRRRPGKSASVGLSGAGGESHAQKTHEASGGDGTVKAKQRIVVAYGSNAGTCKTLAEDFQAIAPEHGFEAEVKSLDSITEDVPEHTPVILIASSYEGKPTDNAKKFMSWLEILSSSKTGAFNKVSFAVFGVGNTEWSNTYQKIPKDIHKAFLDQGATEVCEPYFSDVKVNVSGDWETWLSKLWGLLKSSGHAGTADQKAELTVTIVRQNASSSTTSGSSGADGEEDKSWGIVKSTRSLGGKAVGPEKREINIQLPDGVDYQTGDYISVQPLNHPDVVTRALARFDLSPDDLVTVANTRKAFLATGDKPVLASQLFAQKIELGTPATQKQLEAIAATAEDEKKRETISRLATADAYVPEVIRKNYSVLDVLDDHRSAVLPLSRYLDMVKPLAPRQYSISSSPLDPSSFPSSSASSALSKATGQDSASHPHDGPIASLTYDVHSAPSFNNPQRTFHGAASSYLARLQPGSRVRCAVRATNVSFHLPHDPLVPVVLIAAGTGLAPMRGFIQERAAIAAARGPQALGPAILYFGCRDYEHDNIYRDELDAAEKAGAVSARRAFSKRGPPETDGERFAYVHERIAADAEELSDLFVKGAKFFVCGSAAKLAKSAARAVMQIYAHKFPEKTEQEVQEWWQSIKETRYVTDVYD